MVKILIPLGLDLGNARPNTKTVTKTIKPTPAQGCAFNMLTLKETWF